MLKDFCTDKNDPFLEEKTYWVITLSDGTVIYQDDNKPNIEESSAWIRLGHYIRATNLYIVKFHLQFRDHIVRFPSNKIGYYFSHGALGAIGVPTVHFAVVGNVDQRSQEYITCQWFHVPALELTRINKKLLKDVKEPQIIWNEENIQI